MRRAALIAAAALAATSGSAFSATDEADADRYREQIARERAQHERVVDRLRATPSGHLFPARLVPAAVSTAMPCFTCEGSGREPVHIIPRGRG